MAVSFFLNKQGGGVESTANPSTVVLSLLAERGWQFLGNKPPHGEKKKSLRHDFGKNLIFFFALSFKNKVHVLLGACGM